MENNNAASAFKPSPANVTIVNGGGSILPSFSPLTLKAVLAMDLRGFQMTEKKDGVTAVKVVRGTQIVGEQMADGTFWAFDLIQDGPLRVRWTALQAFLSPEVRIVPCGYGTEFVEAVFANPKSEGVVGKFWDSPFGYDIFKCKKFSTFDVRVTDKLRGAIAISFENQDAGKCALSGLNYDAVRVGDVVEIAAFRRNVSGKFREPRFIRIRHDKV